jgi:hypothetical protein
MANLFTRLKRAFKSADRRTVDVIYGDTPVPNPDDNTFLKTATKEDPELAANVRRFIDNALQSVPKVVPKGTKKVSKTKIVDYNEQLSDVRFYKLLRKVFYDLIWNGNAFLEVKFSGTKLREMYNIDPETITIKQKNGVVEKYIQTIGDKETTLKKENIVHLSVDHLDTGVWGTSFISSLTNAVNRKHIAEDYLAFILAGNKLAPIVDVKADNLDDITWSHIINQINMKAVDPNLNQVINTNIDDRIELIHLFNTDNFDDITKYIQRQTEMILTVLQVPPIISGAIDDSNRSNSEVQARLVFYNTIKAFQNLVAEELNFELLKQKLKWDNVIFKFESIDTKSETDVVKNAKAMRELGYTQEAIHEYMIKNGVVIKEDFEEVEGLEKLGKPENSDEFASREPRDKSGLVEKEADRIEDRQMGVSSNAN